ncbi:MULTISPECIES: DoxX family protein [Pseudomonas]|uniref:DoxX family protein n=1 Tax=Pseudomonas lini TaxID=163011 RepID=A0A0J6HLY6_9PSED|nr:MULTISPECIES: DoxX family protein [Pseudomonas]KAB0507219.1 DoxX family protein [Pseudomonas lini]KMM95498.1 DoxX family protein [Pseudomonas lini]KNH46000.1 DoxX family protein [Pseudomonas lini]MDT9673217.1 DoxX family protein [Pseudomonas sp. JV414]NSX07269.1 DoxX family protein [Pseudomonas lini]
MTNTSSLSPIQKRILWGVRIFLALTFAAAGIAKLAGVPQMIQVFDAVGVGQWFRYLTGTIEVVGAVLLLVPVTGFYAGLLLTATMAGALVTHLFVIGGNPAPALVLLAMSAFVTWRQKPAAWLGAAS